MGDDHVAILAKHPIAFGGSAAGLERFFRLEHWRVKAGEREDDRIVWIRGAFVLIVALTPGGKVVALREYKQAAGEVLLGLPAGAVRKGEMPEAAALRELREESGYSGSTDRCCVLGPFLNAPDKSTERHFVVFIQDAVESGPSEHDESETILGVELLEPAAAKREMRIGLHRMALQEVLDLLADQGPGK